MGIISKVQGPHFESGLSFLGKCGLFLFAVLMGVLLTYYTRSSPLPIQAFSLLATWVMWQDVRCRVIEDRFFAILFGALAFVCCRGGALEFVLSYVVLYCFSVMVDCFSTTYRKEMKGFSVRYMYFGRSGYLIGWMQASFLLLSIYMLAPLQLPDFFLSVNAGWKLLAGDRIMSLCVMIVLSCATFIFYRILILSEERALRRDVGNRWVRKSNMRPHAAWFLASFGALLGLPLSLCVFLLSFLLYLPLYLRKQFCDKDFLKQEWYEAENVSFPFLAHLKKGP